MKKTIIITISISIFIAVVGAAFVFFQKNDGKLDFLGTNKDGKDRGKDLPIGPELASDFLEFEIGATESPKADKIFSDVESINLEKIEIGVPERKLEVASSSLELEMPEVKPIIKVIE